MKRPADSKADVARPLYLEKMMPAPKARRKTSLTRREVEALGESLRRAVGKSPEVRREASRRGLDFAPAQAMADAVARARAEAAARGENPKALHYAAPYSSAVAMGRSYLHKDGYLVWVALDTYPLWRHAGWAPSLRGRIARWFGCHARSTGPDLPGRRLFRDLALRPAAWPDFVADCEREAPGALPRQGFNKLQP